MRLGDQMNEMELDLLAGLTPRQQILLKRPHLAKVLTLRVDPSYWIYTNTPDNMTTGSLPPCARTGLPQPSNDWPRLREGEV